MMRHSIALFVGLTWLAGTLHSIVAQDQKQVPAYEVVSVRPSPPDGNGRPQARIIGDGWLERNNTVSWLLSYAFHIPDPERIKNAPSWAATERFDVETRVMPGMGDALQHLTLQQQGALLQPVLVDRFHLKYHLERRDFPVFFLEVAKGGPKLTEAKPDENGKYHSSMHTKNMSEFIGTGLTPEMMTVNLTYFAGRQVVDHTGLVGYYDFDLTWTKPDSSDNSAPAGSETPGGVPFFAAVERQLGLKLVPGTAKFDVLVVDSVEHPTAN